MAKYKEVRRIIEVVCMSCWGTGLAVGDKCLECRGKGKVQRVVVEIIHDEEVKADV